MSEQVFFFIWIAGIIIGGVGTILYAGYKGWGELHREPPMFFVMMAVVFWPITIMFFVFILPMFPLMWLAGRLYGVGKRFRHNTNAGE